MVARLKALSKMVENRHSRLSWGQVGVLPALIWCLRTRTRTPASMRGHKGFPRLGRGQAGFQLRARTLNAVKLMDHVQVCSSQVSKVKSRKRRKRRKRSTNHNALCGSPELSLDYANITVYTPGVTLATRTEPALRTLPLPSNGLPRKHVSCGCRRSRRRPHFIQGVLTSSSAASSPRHLQPAVGVRGCGPDLSADPPAGTGLVAVSPAPTFSLPAARGCASPRRGLN